MKMFILAACGLIALAGCEVASEPDSVIDRHTAALGGEAAIELVQAVRVQVEVTEPGFTVRGDYRAARDGTMRIDIYDGETRVFTEALNGEAGWQMFASGEVADLSAEGEAALQQGITGNLYGLHEYDLLGHQVTAGQPEMIDGMEYAVIDIVFADGRERRFYLDPETWLVARERSEYALHPDVNPEEDIFETRYSDYRQISDVWRAFATERVSLRSGETVQTTRILDLEINPVLDPAQFARPAGSNATP